MVDDTSTRNFGAEIVQAALGLELHAPPLLTACWHAPGKALFLVFTRRGAPPVRFLPEQILKGEGR
jgi:hypothetical protein